MIPKVIFQPLYLKCSECNKEIEIAVPYKHLCSDGKQDLYVKDRLEQAPDLCNCDGAYENFEREYRKMNLNYKINH